MRAYSLRLVPLVLLGGCGGPGEPETDTGVGDSEADTDSDARWETDDRESGWDTDIDPNRRNQAQRCQHGGYLDAWFPMTLHQMQRFEPEGPLEYPMYSLDPVNHPGWRLNEELSVETRWFGERGFLLLDQRYPGEDVPGADPSVMPEFGGVDEKGAFTQDGTRLIIESPSYFYDCTRRIRPVDPRSPRQQDEFLCVDRDGQESVWWGIAWLEGAWVDADCLAQHDPPDLPTRYSLWERTDENGTSTFAHRVYDGRNFTATTQDLVLRKNGSAQIVKQVTGYIAETDRITWPSRTETALTWARSDRGLSLVLEGGSSMDCTFDENIGELGDAIRTFALACEGSDGVRTWWVPMDMTWPWGWGTHDTPYGWWWEAE